MTIVHMKKALLFIFLITCFCAWTQQLTLKKGRIIDDLQVNDSLSESFALYLPKNFSLDKQWPIVFVYDIKGRAKQAISLFVNAAEKEGYILAASKAINDSLKLSENVLISNRLFHSVNSLLPIQKERVYTAGFNDGARMAALMPVFISDIQGILSFGAAIPNKEVLSTKNKFHFIGIVSVMDYNYTQMLNSKLVLDRLKFQNQLFVYEGNQNLPYEEYISRALKAFTVAAINSNILPPNSEFIEKAYREDLGRISALVKLDRPVRAHGQLLDMVKTYKGSKYVDSLKLDLKTLKRTKAYRSNLRSLNNALFKENFLKDEYAYFMEEDVAAYNYNNLGWWKYQIEELNKYLGSANVDTRHMGARLKGYLNALIADNLDIINANIPVDEEAVTLLWMINTITDSSNALPYLKVISHSARVEDYGTALYYLEELLKIGYTNKEELYKLEHTALLRITPEFNSVIRKYWKETRH